MSTPFSGHDKPDIKALLEAVAHNPNDPTLSHMLTQPQWTVLSGYMQSSTLAPGQVLITQGAEDRTLYFVEFGLVEVFVRCGGRAVHSEPLASSLRRSPG